jgi:hypothetical protein
MIIITKREKDYLESLGYKFGNNNVLHKTYSKHPTYYATEKKDVLKALENFRKNGD